MPHGPRFEKLVREAKAHLEEVTADEAARRQAAGEILIDVRELAEFTKAHATGARHLSKGVLEVRIEQEVPQIETPIICYCGGGSRSALAAANLQKMGYLKVSSMIGGFKAWTDAGLPTQSGEDSSK